MQDVRAVIEIAKVLLELVETAGKEGIPSGHLYAMVMHMLSLEQYNQLIDILKRAGKIEESSHLLRATCTMR